MGIPTYDEFVKVQAPAIERAYREKHGHLPGITDIAHNLYRLIGEGWTFANVIHGIKDEPLEGGRPQGPEESRPTPAPAPEPPPSAAQPVPSTSASYVAAIKAMLEGQGVSLSGPCGAFEITKRVAWGLRGRGWGLLDKPGGNNCNGYATDIVMQNDGSGAIVDILGDGGNGNFPNWGVSAPGEVDPARWRAPVEP